MRAWKCAPALLTALAALPLGCAGNDGNPPANVGQTPYGAPQPYGSAQPPAYGQPTPYGSPPPGYAQQPQPSPYPTQTPYPAPGAVPGAPAPAPNAAQTPLGPVMTTDPNQLQAIFTQAASAAQAFLQPPGSAPAPNAAPAQPGSAPGVAPAMGMPTDLVDAGIKVIALMNAKGMQPEGSQAKGQLAEGAHLEFMIPMQAGKCYTLVGFSPPGQVRNLDLNLLAPPFYNVLAGQDTTDDNAPVIGKTPNPMCPVVPVPLNYKVDIVARAGAGQVGVQLFSRTK